MSINRLKWYILVLFYRLGLWTWISRARSVFNLLSKKPHEPDFEIFRLFNGDDGLFVDIGANSGQSAISFRIFNQTFRTLSFEPNPLHEKDLRFVKKLVGKNFEYQMIGIGNESLSRKLLVPSPSGFPLTQEATFSKEELHYPVTRQRIRSKCHTDDFSVLEFDVPLRKLDDFELKPDFVKLDVQGYELKTLEGMQNTLSLHRPIILVENGKDILPMAEFLKPLGYAFFQYDPTTQQFSPIRDLHWGLNVFFIPPEKHAFLAQHGVDLSKTQRL